MPAQSVAIKRIAREKINLERDNEDYFVKFSDEDLLNFDAYVVGPMDSLYQHKLIKLRFHIPDNYPLSPPKVKFIQHTGGRIHPNLYVDGKVCLSILGTWEGEPWALAMSCDTVLVTIRSLLDNQPYKHEPGQQNSPEFNRYVEYTGWRSLLLDYLQRETSTPHKTFIQRHISRNASQMKTTLRLQQERDRANLPFRSPYGSPAYSSAAPSWSHLIEVDMSKAIDECTAATDMTQMAEEVAYTNTCSPAPEQPKTNPLWIEEHPARARLPPQLAFSCSNSLTLTSAAQIAHSTPQVETDTTTGMNLASTALLPSFQSKECTKKRTAAMSSVDDFEDDNVKRIAGDRHGDGLLGHHLLEKSKRPRLNEKEVIDLT